ncbi:MAG: hypothetical protein IK136_05105 [Oscillospiraceae bacterium]|nr:hypothetical protein [Oscillospiraceae bacterium]
MYHFQYVTKKQAAPYREELIEIIKNVQNEVREQFLFQFTFIGSSSRNMITFDPTTNTGFDFDVNLEVKEKNSPKETRTILLKAFNHVIVHHGYNVCEDSTRVLTIKTVDYWRSKTLYHCDFAIVYEGRTGQQYIRFNKKDQTYTWEFQTKPYERLEKRADYLKDNGYWAEVRKIYLDKKNGNNNPDKRSRSLYAEAVNECFQRRKYG